MCVIIHQPKDNRQVTLEEFQSAWQSNPHGFWLMYFSNDKVCVEKSMKMMESWDIYNNLASELEWETDFVLHFRWATHGSKNLDNTHPFPCGNGKYLVHNWVLGYESQVPSETDYSDTRLFASTLEKFPWEWLDSEVMCDFVQSVCTWDKVLVMDNTWKVYYFGDKWEMSPDWKLWASNDSPFHGYKYYGETDYRLSEEEKLLKEGFFEDGIWISNKEYCERYGIPYDSKDWE